VLRVERPADVLSNAADRRVERGPRLEAGLRALEATPSLGKHLERAVDQDLCDRRVIEERDERLEKRP
jgi:hypothetical protein